MKKSLLIFILSFMLVVGISVPSFASPVINVDDSQLTVEPKPIIKEGKTFIPMRAIFNALGAEVFYDTDNQIVRAFRGESSLSLKAGQPTAIINSLETNMIESPFILDGRLMVPLRVVSEALGAKVSYENNVISITSKEVKVHFIDVGFGDATLIQLPDNKNILIDAGDREHGPVVEQYLYKQGIKNIDLLLSTSPKEEHMGGMAQIVSKIAVGKVIDSGKSENNEAYRRFSEELKKKDIIKDYANKQIFKYQDITFEILTNYFENLNNDLGSSSVVTRLKCGDISFLFLGDITGEQLRRYQTNNKANIVKLGDHGSAESVKEDFIKIIKPDLIIISTGKDLQYPTPETINSLSGNKLNFNRTDVNGTIVITTNSKNFTADTEKEGDLLTTVQVKPLPPLNYGVYVGDKNGNTYHLPSCRKAKEDIEPYDKVWFLDSYHAKTNGYEPCELCQPDQTKL